MVFEIFFDDSAADFSVSCADRPEPVEENGLTTKTMTQMHATATEMTDATVTARENGRLAWRVAGVANPEDGNDVARETPSRGVGALVPQLGQNLAPSGISAPHLGQNNMTP